MTRVFTIGHSNRKWSDFISILKDNHIDVLADVRRYPGSRACPQFNKEQMTTDLRKENVSYVLMGNLEDETSQISKMIGEAMIIIIIMLDGKTRALELMLIIWQPRPL